jgi:TIR domain
MRKVFVSYSHQQGEWVRDRLIPVLRAAELEVLFDGDFAAGKSLVGQMDATQDRAERQVLVLSPEYLASGPCRHEMRRAIALDPEFAAGLVIPIVRVKVDFPGEIREPNPLYVKLDDVGEREAGNWGRVLEACKGRADWSALAWLEALAEVRLFLERRQSVSLVVSGNPPWRALLRELRTNNLAEIDLDSPATHTDWGLVNEIFRQLGSKRRAAAGPGALAELERHLETLPTPPTLVLLHFDRAGRRFGGDFFSALRYLIDGRRLVALFQSRQPFLSIVPADDPLSGIDLKRVDLT